VYSARRATVRLYVCAMRRKRLSRRLPGRPARIAAAAIALAGLAGCAATGASPGANDFYRAHAHEAARAAAAARAVQNAVAGLPPQPTAAQLQALATAARRGRRYIAPASEWSVTENGEEEDLSQAELELNEGANAFLDATYALRSYARVPRAATLARYRQELASGRERWNQGVHELWYLAHEPDPPTA
jgi:hypothetical protein